MDWIENLSNLIEAISKWSRMMLKNHRFLRCWGTLVILLLLTGCGLNITVKEPTLSTVNYARQDIPQATLNIVDARLPAVYLGGQP